MSATPSPEAVTALLPELAELVVSALNLEIAAGDIDPDAPLFGEGLGLDSIDALQLVVAMEKDFGVVVPDAETGTVVFQSVRSMAGYIAEHRK